MEKNVFAFSLFLGLIVRSLFAKTIVVEMEFVTIILKNKHNIVCVIQVFRMMIAPIGFNDHI